MQVPIKLFMIWLNNSKPEMEWTSFLKINLIHKLPEYALAGLTEHWNSKSELRQPNLKKMTRIKGISC